jgi:hypothetical protein
MSKSPSKTLDGFASELKGIADYLMDNRAYLTMKDLKKVSVGLKSLKTSVSGKLSVKQKQNFNSNIDEVEDLLDALMRQIQFDQHTGPNFTKAVRSASHYLYAAAALLSISAIIFSMHPPQ